MEKHAIPSQGRYFVWREGTNEFRGPFFPQTRTERIDIFVRETRDREGTWNGCYYRRLPVHIRALIKEAV